MLEAMYDEVQDLLQTKLNDYDSCSNMGSAICTQKLQYIFTLRQLVPTTAIASLKCTSAGKKKIRI
jgi:hypothetical protein